MTVVVDAGPLIGAALLDHPLARKAADFLLHADEPLVLPAPVVAEVDYLLQARIGPGANRPFLRDLAAGRFRVESLDLHDYAIIERLNARYTGLSPGIADLSIVVVAARLNTTRILTFDARHFRVLQPLGGGAAFALLPADE